MKVLLSATPMKIRRQIYQVSAFKLAFRFLDLIGFTYHIFEATHGTQHRTKLHDCVNKAATNVVSHHQQGITGSKEQPCELIWTSTPHQSNEKLIEKEITLVR